MPDDPARVFLGAFGNDPPVRSLNHPERHPAREPEPSTEISSYVDRAMYDAAPLREGARERPRVFLLSATPDPLGAVAAFSMIYEGKPVYDLSAVTDEQRRFYWEEAFKTALKAPLEAIDFHFMVEGLTRASWDQMVRQRTAVFGGESLRFAVKDDLTEAVRPGPNVRTKRQREIHARALRAIDDGYHALIGEGVPAEDARGLLPMNVLTRGHWKTNLRNLEAEIGKRTCTQAQWEWRLIAAGVVEAIREYKGLALASGPGASVYVGNAWQFQLIADSPMWQPICFSTGRCMFKAHADRGCTIRERVEAGDFAAISAEEWALDPTAGWVR